MVRIAPTAIVGSLALVGVAWVVLAFAHGDLAIRAVPVERSAGRDWWTSAFGLIVYPLVVVGGFATPAWWTYKFLRARFRRRGPWG